MYATVTEVCLKVDAPTIVIKSTKGPAALGLRDVWAYRELLYYFLVWRDVKVRCKQDHPGPAVGDPAAAGEHDDLHRLPFLVQIWMYLTPVVYGSRLIPEQYRFLLSLNPMTRVVEGFRWALLGGELEQYLSGPLLGVSVGISVLVLVSGAFFFRRTERSFADIV